MMERIESLTELKSFLSSENGIDHGDLDNICRLQDTIATKSLEVIAEWEAELTAQEQDRFLWVCFAVLDHNTANSIYEATKGARLVEASISRDALVQHNTELAKKNTELREALQYNEGLVGQLQNDLKAAQTEVGYLKEQNGLRRQELIDAHARWGEDNRRYSDAEVTIQRLEERIVELKAELYDYMTK